MTLPEDTNEILYNIWHPIADEPKKVDWKNEISYLLSLLLRALSFVVAFFLVVWIASASPVLALVLSFIFLLGAGLIDYL